MSRGTTHGREGPLAQAGVGTEKWCHLMAGPGPWGAEKPPISAARVSREGEVMFIAVSQNPGALSWGLPPATERRDTCMYTEPAGKQLHTAAVGNAGDRD